MALSLTQTKAHKEKQWDNTISIQHIPKRKVQMFRDLKSFKFRLIDPISASFVGQKSEVRHAKNLSEDNSKFNISSSKSLETVITSLGVKHQNGTSPYLEMEVIKLIIHREGFVMELKHLNDAILKDNELSEKRGLKVLELLSQIKKCTVAYIEALCLWRQSTFDHESEAKKRKKIESSQESLRLFYWEGGNYTIKLIKDLDFLAENSLIVSALGISSANQMLSNPLMLPNSLDDINTWMDPFERALVDAVNNGEKAEGAQFETRLKLRLAERILLQELELTTSSIVEKNSNLAPMEQIEQAEIGYNFFSRKKN